MSDSRMKRYLKDKKPIIINIIDNNDVDDKNNYIKSKEYFNQEKDQDQDQNQDRNQIIIPPLNTDIRFKPKKKTNNFKSLQFRKGKKIPTNFKENFSWGVKSDDDSEEENKKKDLINHVVSQFACGSCWAISVATAMSDCFVVSGIVDWKPLISATYIMSVIPKGNIHDMCFGGNPAEVCEILENTEVSDTRCVDYSWCSGDNKYCTSIDSSKHFDANELTEHLNENVPKPHGCYFEKETYMYKIDKDSTEVKFITNNDIEKFRNDIKSHILNYGSIIGGFVVLRNFFLGIHTKINGGVYFDRGDYTSINKISFSDRNLRSTEGLHAVCIVGWGVAKNIEFDNGKYGDVPYWHCRNSWGVEWGDNGYFKMAMYPFNTVSQFDKQVTTDLGGPIGSMLLIKTTKKPIKKQASTIKQKYIDNIIKQKDDSFYIKENIKSNLENTDNKYLYNSSFLIILVVFIFIILIIIKYK